MVPRLFRVALFPLTVTATVLPLTDKVTPAFTVPVWPEPEPRVWAVDELPVSVKLPAKALPGARVIRRVPSVKFRNMTQFGIRE
jgi:hypothetical protein